MLPATDRPAALRPKQEVFAQRYAATGNATKAYREAFDAASMTPATIRQRAYELVHEPAVAARVRELLAIAAEGTTISARTRMVRLQDIVEADPSELVQVVSQPCATCWNDDMVLATAWDRAIAAGTEAPDTNTPRQGCEECRGHGAPRVVITPTDQLSPAARRLLKSVRQKVSGEVEVRFHCQLAAADMLNKMQGVYIDRSVSVTANVNVPAFSEMTHEQQLAFLETLKPTAND